MTSIPNYKCWEIMNCENSECPARLDPETPCWEIAKGIEAFVDLTDTCKDCIVFILQGDNYILSKKELHNIVLQKWLLNGSGPGGQACF